MYASNDEEFYRDNDDNDWVFLRRTPPATTLVNTVETLRKHERISSNSSSSSSSSSQSVCSEPASSISLIECKHTSNNEQEQQILVEDPILTNQNMDEHNEMLSTGETKDEISPTEILVKQTNENETTPIINEYDLPNNGQDFIHEMTEQSNILRRRSGANISEIIEQNPIRIEEIHSSSMNYISNRESNSTPVTTHGSYIFIWITLLILGLTISAQRSKINELTNELKKMNQRLDEIKSISIENIQEKLIKQLDIKFHQEIQRKQIEFEENKISFISQINELHHLLHLTKQNLTNIIHQISIENQQLHERVIALEHRFESTEKYSSKKKEECPEGSDCTNSPILSFDALLNHLIKQTASIAENTSGNLSNLFEQLSTTLSDLVDHRHELVEEGKRKLSDFAGSETAEQVQTTIRRGVENLSSSFRKVQSSYSAWLRTRAEQRDKARTEQDDEEEKSIRRPWRWTFQRGHEREQMRHQSSPTKKHSIKRENSCHSKCYHFPVNHICTIKHWLERFFHP